MSCWYTSSCVASYRTKRSSTRTMSSFTNKAVRFSFVLATSHSSICGRLGAIWQINRYQQKPFSVFAPHQIASFRVGEALFLIFAHDDRHDDATGKGQQRDAIEPLETHETLIVWDRSKRSKVWSFCFVALVRFADLSDTTYRHLSRKPEALTQCGVVKFLQQDFVAVLRSNASPANQSAAALNARMVASSAMTCSCVGRSCACKVSFMKLNYRQVLSIFQDLAALPPPTKVGGFRAWSSVKILRKIIIRIFLISLISLFDFLNSHC